MPERILLVEDNPGDARLLREALGDVRDTQIEFSHVGRLDEALGRLHDAEDARQADERLRLGADERDPSGV